jgi:excisionase family DNA binding protein
MSLAHLSSIAVIRRPPQDGSVMTTTTTPPHLTGAFTIKELCDAYRLCREKAYGEIRARRLRAVKLGRKTLILRADAEAWAASLPELRTIGRDGHGRRS